MAYQVGAPAAVPATVSVPVPKGSATPNTASVATITASQLREIAQQKMSDLNANDLDAAEKIIAGTARSMGIKIQ